MQKFYSFLREFTFPQVEEIKKVFLSLSKKELIVSITLSLLCVTSLLIFFIKLNNRFLVEIPTYGGSLTEGIIGTPRFINPVLAISDADKDLTALVYSGLMKKDVDGHIVPNLAESYEISKDGLIYTFKLKDDIYFHDGKPVTADDVIYTIGKVKDVLLKSPKQVNWEGVSVEKLDERTVQFTLKQPYISFLENDATLGILPYHIWKDATIEEFTFSDYNTRAIGTGPYKISSINKKSSGVPASYNLTSFKNYVEGKPFITNINFKFYANERDLIDAFKKGDVDQISTITPENAEMLKQEGARVETSVLPRMFGLFFNQSQNPIFTDTSVIKAFNLAINKDSIVNSVLGGYAVAIDSPLPPSLTQENLTETQYTGSLEQARTLLEKSGWTLGADGIREKKNKKQTQKLSFSIATSDTPELKQSALSVKSDLEKIGAQVDVKVYEIGTLNQNVIRPRKYEALFFGQVITHEADLYAFWHSSQRNDPGFNIALYTNTKVDKILESLLTTQDRSDRTKKYVQFEQEIKKDSPAVFIYSPEFIYVLDKHIGGFKGNNIGVSADRFSGISSWYTETEKIWKAFLPKTSSL